MGRGAWRGIVCSVAALCGVACGSLLEVGEDGPPAGVDAGPLQAGPAGDATAPPTDGGLVSPCSGGPYLFCDDFELGDRAKWDQLVNSGGATSSFVTSDARGKVFSVHVPQQAAFQNLFLQQPLGVHAAVVVTFLVKVTARTPSAGTGNVGLVGLTLLSAQGQRGSIYWSWSGSSGSRFQVTGGQKTAPTFVPGDYRPMTLDNWTRLRLEVVYGPSGSVVASADDAVIGKLDLTLDTGTPLLQLGPQTNQDAPEVTVEYDDVVVEALPQ